jgi:hypothetical protein
VVLVGNPPATLSTRVQPAGFGVVVIGLKRGRRCSGVPRLWPDSDSTDFTEPCTSGLVVSVQPGNAASNAAVSSGVAGPL